MTGSPESRGIEIGWWPSEQILELQTFIGSEWRESHILARDERLLRWQHRRNERELSVAYARLDGGLVGMLGAIATDVSMRGARETGAWLTNWLVVPSARSQGVGLRLLRFVIDNHDFVGTVGGNETTLRILRTLRFDVTTSMPRWIAPDLSRDGVPSTVYDWNASVAERWDEAWATRFAPTLVGTWRDAAYIGWRYADHPTFEYRIRVALDDAGAAVAIVVHRLETERDGTLTALRVVEALGEHAPLARLLADALAEGGRSGAAFADFYCTTERYAPALTRAGFRRENELERLFPSRLQPLEEAPRPISVAVSAATDGGTLLDSGDVYLTRSDGDQDRPN